jgi:hypothetical protein
VCTFRCGQACSEAAVDLEDDVSSLHLRQRRVGRGWKGKNVMQTEVVAKKECMKGENEQKHIHTLPSAGPPGCTALTTRPESRAATAVRNGNVIIQAHIAARVHYRSQVPFALLSSVPCKPTPT